MSIKNKLILLTPILLGVLTITIEFSPQNLPEALNEYRNTKDIESTQITLLSMVPIILFLIWFPSYMAVIFGKKAFLKICIIFFIAYVISMFSIEAYAVTGTIMALEKLTIFCFGFALGYQHNRTSHENNK